MIYSRAIRSAEPSSRTQHFHALDGLRGIAVLAVLGYHFGASFLTGGYLGVDVFFVISGFVVTRNLIRLREDGGWARTFYLRRVSRLYPALLAMLAAVSLVWLFDGSFGEGRVAALVGAVLMSYNLAALYFDATLEGAVHLWSLGVEWHFYLLAPALLAFDRRIRPALRSLLLMATAGAVAFVRLMLLGTGTIDSLTAYLNTLTRLDGLLLGAAIAVAPVALLQAIPTRRVLGLMVTGILAAMLIGPAWAERAAVTLGLVVPAVGVLSAVAIVAVVNAVNAGTGRTGTQVLLESPVLLWAGQRSYSLYLAHYFIGVTLIGSGEELWQGWPTFLFQVTASLAAGEILHRLVERPGRRAINRLI